MSALDATPRIFPFLWFPANAVQAVDFYLSVFKNSRLIGKMPLAGTPLTISFELEGLHFTALNVETKTVFTEAVSFVVLCDTQQEIDFYWSKLAEQGSEGRCGWLKDQFGVSWQIVPRNLAELLQSKEAMQAMLRMNKLSIAELEDAAKSD